MVSREKWIVRLAYVALSLLFVGMLVWPCLGQAQGPVAPRKGLLWRAGTVVSPQKVDRVGVERCFRVEPIPDEVFARMRGKSYPAHCRVSRESLRYVRLLHRDADGRIRMGELVCGFLSMICFVKSNCVLIREAMKGV